jgi:glycosyltransferase involved in cell wall biosynthesis
MMISIIIPIYNSEKFLKDCINSVLNQNYNDFELLLVNDGSIDRSGQICDSFALTDVRIKVFHKVNSGVSSARNHGLSKAKGDYIIFIDSDDTIKEGLLNHSFNKLSNNNIDVLLYTLHSLDNRNLEESFVILDKFEALSKLSAFKLPTSLWLGVYSRNILFNLKLDENIHFYEDFEYQSRVFSICDFIGVSNYCFYTYKNNHNSANNKSNISGKVLTCLNIVEKNEISAIYSHDELISLHVFFLFKCIFYALKSEYVDNNMSLMFTKLIRKKILIIILSKYNISYKLISFFIFMDFRIAYFLFAKYYKRVLKSNVYN